MLKLKELRFKNIGRFTEEQIVRLDNLGTLVQVDGQNNNTGGSSGSGKTTVFNALDYLLGLNDLPTTVLQSRLTKEAISVSGTFDFDGKQLIISRNKGKLSIDLEGDVTVGSSKLSEEQLDEILGMSRHLFRPTLHKRQKEGGFFLQFTPKETHEFLTDCLGLSELRSKTEIVEKKIKELEENKAKIEGLLASSQAALRATQEALLALGPAPVKDMQQEVILQLKSKWEASVLALQAIETKHSIELAALDLERPSVEIKEFDKSTKESCQKERASVQEQIHSIISAKQAEQSAVIQAIQQERSDIQAKIHKIVSDEQARQNDVNRKISELRLQISKLTSMVTSGDSAKQQAIQLANEVKKLRQNICPTCEQPWLTDTIKVREDLLINQIKTCKESIDRGAVASVEMASANDALTALIPQTSPIINPELDLFKTRDRDLSLAVAAANAGPPPPPELEQLKVRGRALDLIVLEESKKETDFLTRQNLDNKLKTDEFAAKQRALRETHVSESSTAHGQADLDRRSLDSAVSKLKSYEEASKRYEITKATLSTQESARASEIVEKTDILSQEMVRLSMAEELKRLLKSFISCSFDEVLDSISDTATKFIRNVPVMQNATIQLEGTRETKDGKIKEEVNAVISMDGESEIPIKSLSGGERSAVDLAVDLAVIDLIESRTGMGIDLHVLDEPFTGLDTIGIEMALEVLKSSNINKRLILVEHNPIIKEFVSDRITITRDGENSRIIG